MLESLILPSHLDVLFLWSYLPCNNLSVNYVTTTDRTVCDLAEIIFVSRIFGRPAPVLRAAPRGCDGKCSLFLSLSRRPWVKMATGTAGPILPPEAVYRELQGLKDCS